MSERPLLEDGAETFIRYNELISIMKKVQSKNEKSFESIVSANDPFGFDVRVKDSFKRIKPNFKLKKFPNSVEFYYNGWRKEGVGYIDKNSIRKGHDLLDKYKVYIPKAWGIGDPATDWLNPFIGAPNSCCTETYLSVGPFSNIEIADNVVSYIQTKFFHILVSIVKITQNSMQKVYTFVPMQDFSKQWTDDELFAKYELNEDEIAFIESMIKPMGGGDANAD